MENDKDNKADKDAVSTAPSSNPKAKSKSSKPYKAWTSKEFIDAISKGTLKLAKRKGTRAACWKQFYVILVADTNEIINNTVQCKICKTILHPADSNTTTMNRHMKKCPAKTPKAQQTITSFVKPSKNSNKLATATKRVLYEKTVSLTSKDILPFRVVEGAGMIEFAHYLVQLGGEYYKDHKSIMSIETLKDALPSDDTVSKYTNQIAKEKFNRLISFFDKKCKTSYLPNVGFNTDMWKEQYNNRHFIVVNASYHGDNVTDK